jgi:CDP-diacylglycerol---glycerol-3-phosphate 3-phosphatidyltransferase
VSAGVARIRRFGEGAIATPANAITIVRLVLAIPVLVLVAEHGSSWLTFTGWVVLSATDGLDGWVARRDGTTRSGAFLDPLADKILVLGGFAALAVRGDFPWIAVALVAGRELGISAYRSWAARRGVSLPARPLGKWKANLQFLAVATVLFPPTGDLVGVQQAALWAAVALTLVSGLDIVLSGRRGTATEPRPA